jgi:hypothetical protein
VHLIPLIERSKGEACVTLPELVVPYDPVVLRAWQQGECLLARLKKKHKICHLPSDSPEKRKLIADLLGGDRPDLRDHLFGRPASVFWDQPQYNWPEFTWCCTLAQRQYPLSQIVYENWRASARSSAFRSSEGGGGKMKGKYAVGTAVLRRALPLRFFADYADLIEVNRASLTHRSDPHDASVDVFAAKEGELGFFEMKRDEGARKEKVLRHQTLALALLAVAASRAWPPGSAPVVRVGFVRFSDRERSAERLLPTPVQVLLPIGW